MEKTAVSSGPESGTAEVKLQGATDVSRIAAGQEFMLAARFQVAPGWHIYWENPGETGLATRVEFEMPEGFVAGPVMFPGPERFESPGGIVSYGYKDEVWLSTMVSTPDALPLPEYRFGIHASWLACRESCIKQEAVLTVPVQTASADAPSTAVSNPGIDRHKQSLPRALEERAGAQAEWKSEGASRILVLSVKGGDRLEYFPSQAEQIKISGQALMPDDQVARLYVTYKSAGVTAGGVLRVEEGPRVAYYRINLKSQ